MARSKTNTHEKIVAAAKQEILEKGFEKASMRSIGNKVGLTQAALYRHFESKEAMFSELVKPALDFLNDIYTTHVKRQFKLVDEQKTDELFEDTEVTMIRKLLNKYKEEMQLLLNCSEGTKYSNFIHDNVKKQEEEMMKAIAYLKEQGIKVKDVTSKEMHVLLSAYMTAICEPIIHNWNDDEIIHNLDLVEEFFSEGFKKILGYN